MYSWAIPSVSSWMAVGGRIHKNKNKSIHQTATDRKVEEITTEQKWLQDFNDPSVAM